MVDPPGAVRRMLSGSAIRRRLTMTEVKPTYRRSARCGGHVDAKKRRRGPRAAMEQFLLAVSGGGGFRPTAIEADRLKRPGGRT